MVEVMKPDPKSRSATRHAGRGGFFLAAFEYISENFPNMDLDEKRKLQSGAFTGWEIVDNTARLCAMNLLLHGIETPESDSPIHVDDVFGLTPVSVSTWC